jgi:predicted CXXCH cytochrome family protein
MKLLLAQITRNKQGQPSRAQLALTADSVRVGRGSDCKLFLADPRVSLHHALIGRSDDGVYFIEAVGGTVIVDGAMERAAKLKVGQKILLGPFELNILPPEGQHELVISWELVEPMEDDATAVNGRVKAGLRNTWLSKRLFSWGAALIILAAFLAWPVMNAHQSAPMRTAAAKSVLAPDESWNPGTLSSAHQGFGRDCVQCHTVPFEHTQNAACENCHSAIGWHFERNTKEAKAMHAAVFAKPGAETMCASCHRDHKGPMGLVRQDSPLCTNCHANIKAQVATTQSPNISDFGKDHPPFKLSMLVPGKTGAGAIVRVSQDAAKLSEKSNLKFPHNTHLDKKGIRGQNGRVVMECVNCHVPDESGTRFKPTTMKEHCQDCHSLEFEPKATNRQVPHGNVEDVLASVSEFYAQAVLADTPIDVVFQEGARRPGERLNVADPGKRLAALKWANQKAETISQELMEVRVCFACHEISRINVGEGKLATRSWKVEPIAITQHWLPKGRFPHVQHKPYECKECHNTADSKSSADISIPDIKNCQSCHAGNIATRESVRGTCETCHGFHVGGSKSGVPIPHPGSTPHDPKARAAKVAAAQ